MRAFELAKGKIELPLVSSRRIKVRAASKTPVTVFAVCGQEKVPIAHGTQLDFREALSRDFTSLILSVHGDGAFGYWFQELEVQSYETLDDQDPPAIPEPRADNLVATLHHELRRFRRQEQPPVLEPDFDDFSMRYHVEDDDFRFEEELAVHSNDAARDAESAADGRDDAERERDEDRPKTRQEPNAAPSEGPGKPPAQQAAE